MVTTRLPSPSSWGRNAANPTWIPLVGGIRPLNLPVAGSSVGCAAALLSTVPFAASNSCGASSPTTSWPDEACGDVVFVMRADSSELGPDFVEFTSNELLAFVRRTHPTVAPESPTRIMRELRDKKKINYRSVKRAKSLYRILPLDAPREEESQQLDLLEGEMS